ncbi:MAG: tetrahydrofolate dehydrogenase/cyclohydrolase catalytic domain-containing protein [Holdemania filiformis]
MAQVIYGSEVSKDIRSELSEQIAALRASGRRMPKLAVILVGENPASLSYVTGKEKACTQVGMESELIKLPATTSQEELMAVVRRLNADPNVDGILCQLPLPDGLDSAQVIREIRPDKDVDGFHPINASRPVNTPFSRIAGIAECFTGWESIRQANAQSSWAEAIWSARRSRGCC